MKRKFEVHNKGPYKAELQYKELKGEGEWTAVFLDIGQKIIIDTKDEIMAKGIGGKSDIRIMERRN